MARLIAWIAAGAAAVVAYVILIHPRGDGPRPEAGRLGDGADRRGVVSSPVPGSGAAASPTGLGPAAGVSADRLIRGRVVDRGGIPVNHARVRVELSTPDDGVNYAAVDEFDLTAPVDADARFSAAVPRNGTYRVHAEAEGFGPVARDGIKPGDDVDLALDLPSRMTGRVFEGRTGQALEGAVLRLCSDAWSFSHSPSARSGADGAYVFEDLPAGSASLPVWLEGFIDPSATAGLTLALGATLHYDVRLERGLTIAGRVVERESGEPIAGATLGGNKAVTDANGAFRLSSYGSGSHDLVAFAKGYLPEWLQVTVNERRAPDDLLFQLVRASSVTGAVLDHEGRPVERATVAQGHDRTETAGDGSFQITLNTVESAADGLVGSRYSLQVERPSHPVVSVLFDDTSSPRPFLIRLDPEDVVVSGRVLALDRSPIPGARVELRSPLVHRLAEADHDGAFAFHGLPREPWFRLEAIARGFDSTALWVGLPDNHRTSRIQVELRPDGGPKPAEGAGTVVVADPPRGLVRGRVVDATTGEAAKGVVVLLFTQEEGGSCLPQHGGTTDSPDFEFAAPPGVYWLAVQAAEFLPVERRRIVVFAGEVTEAGTVALLRTATIEGLIRSASGAAPGRLGIVISDLDRGGFHWAGWTDSTGWFQVAGLARGPWQVFGVDEAAPYWRSNHELAYLCSLGTVHLEPGGLARLDGRMIPPATLVVAAASGRDAVLVADPPTITSECDPERFDYDELPDALAVCIRSSSGVPLVWARNRGFATAFAAVWRGNEPKVELSLSTFAPGDYVVTVRRAGIAVTRAVRLASGAQTSIELELSR